jgi:molecular chaperone GrpE
MTNKKTTGKKKTTYSKKIDELTKEIKTLKGEIREKNEKLLRNIADFQNYQKRIEKELKHREEQTKNKYLSELLDLSELLKKAYKDKNPKDGLKIIINNLSNFFKKEQIQSINCIGKKFDHKYHHAISTIEKDGCEDDTVIEEVKKGYIINDNLLRPSHVIVTKKKNKS